MVILRKIGLHMSDDNVIPRLAGYMHIRDSFGYIHIIDSLFFVLVFAPKHILFIYCSALHTLSHAVKNTNRHHRHVHQYRHVMYLVRHKPGTSFSITDVSRRDAY